MLKLFSPAKINLFLRVVGKRHDGYHDLSSVFQAISLGDTITFELHDQDLLICSDQTLPTDQSNLILKATNLFRKKTGSTDHYKINLDKKIPMQAGLGGGSSNAATALWACNQLSGLHIPVKELLKWSSEIGSDIPFFFSEGSAYCTGRGEHVQNLSHPAVRSLYIVKPSLSLSTADVFRKLGLTAGEVIANHSDDLHQYMSGNLVPFNDFEKVVCELNPGLLKLKQDLMDSGFETVVLTGTGSAFYCLGEPKHPLHSDLQVFKAHFVNRTPLIWYEAHSNHHNLSEPFQS